MKKAFSILLAAALVLSLFMIPAMAAEDEEIDLSTTTEGGEHAPHGYAGEDTILFGYGVIAELGTHNLADYSAVEITYATDPGFTALKEGMIDTACFAIVNEKISIGAGPDGSIQNADKIIAKADCTDAEELNPEGTNWGKNERTARIDLQGSTYNGNIYLAHFNSTGNETLVVNIKLIAKTAGDNPSDNPSDNPADDNKDDNPTDDNQPDNPTSGDASVTVLAAFAVVAAATLAGNAYRKKENN